jgi:dihydrofolate synthase/folylpolyglutamate synthase
LIYMIEDSSFITSLTYQEVLQWLNSFTDTEKNLPTTPVEFNLPRSEMLNQALGSPHLHYPSVVIAGTKGKGSTAAMVESILGGAYLRTGLYTSPSLHSFRERIQINRQLISQEQLVDLVMEVKSVIEQLDPTLGYLSTYEVITGLALAYFAARQVDFAVLEVGLGGRLDAVNVVTPLVSVITSISFDHQKILGNTLGAIAWEKAGIIKAGVPIITVNQHPEAATVIAQVAEQRGAELFVVSEAGIHNNNRGTIPYPVQLTPNSLSLKGLFQMENARLAMGTTMLLRELGIVIHDTAITTGLETVSWPGRLEVLQEQPLVIADCAHNGDSARKLVTALRQIWQFNRLLLVIGVSADKDIEAIARELIPNATTVFLTQSYHPRCASLEQLELIVKPYLCGQLFITNNVQQAVEKALQLAQGEDLICITGSIFVAAAAREVFGRGELD